MQNRFSHIVFFWLKNPTNQIDRNAFEKSLKHFINNSEFVKTKHLGIPADTNRSVIDSSYTYCLSLTFADKADQDSYQVESGHKKFIADSAPLWERVLVYDSEDLLT